MDAKIELEVSAETNKIHPQRYKSQSCLSKFRDVCIKAVKTRNVLFIYYFKIIQKLQYFFQKVNKIIF